MLKSFQTLPLKNFNFLTTVFFLYLLTIYSPAFAAPPKDDETTTEIINLVRAGDAAFADTRAKLVRLLIEVNHNAITPAQFYEKASKLPIPAGQELRHTLIQIKTELGNYKGKNYL